MTAIPKGFKPLLSAKAPDDLSKLKFPLYVSPKLDGIRCIVFGGVAYSRNMKPIPNKWVQKYVGQVCPDGFDGELISGDPWKPDAWNKTQSCVMSEDSTAGFTFHVFDWISDAAFEDRFKAAREWCIKYSSPHIIKYVPHRTCRNFEEVIKREELYVRAGFEGVMLRAKGGEYKYGRATTREGTLMKLKRFQDAEATVVGVVEKMHNDNEAKKDELGRTKRSSAKAGKRPAGTMGALVCIFADRSTLSPVEDAARFEIGTGFTDEQRSMIWHNRKEFERWKPVKFKYQGLTPDGVPRFPVFLGLRDARDM